MYLQQQDPSFIFSIGRPYSRLQLIKCSLNNVTIACPQSAGHDNEKCARVKLSDASCRIIEVILRELLLLTMILNPLKKSKSCVALECFGRSFDADSKILRRWRVIHLVCGRQELQTNSNIREETVTQQHIR
jgi:hypothetical protein